MGRDGVQLKPRSCKIKWAPIQGFTRRSLARNWMVAAASIIGPMRVHNRSSALRDFELQPAAPTDSTSTSSSSVFTFNSAATTPAMNVAPLSRRPLASLRNTLRQVRQQRLLLARSMATTTEPTSTPTGPSSPLPDHNFCSSSPPSLPLTALNQTNPRLQSQSPSPNLAASAQPSQSTPPSAPPHPRKRQPS
jgi:hypothetical protein